MNIIFPCFILAIILAFAPLPLHADHYKVFILGGQSNMYGADSKPEALPEELQRRQEDVLLFSGSEFSRLKPGSGRSFGPEVTFGRCIADALPHENFYLIKHADGGTSLWNEWNLTDGRSYTRLKNVVQLGLEALTKAGHTFEIAGILWTQGERDAWNLRTTAQYEADLKALMADMRARFGADLPFFFSRLSVLQKARPVEAVRKAQELVAAADPNAYLIDTDSFEMQRDSLHFTGQGYIDLGQAYAQAYLNTRAGDSASDNASKRSGNALAGKRALTGNGLIDGAQITVNSSDGSLSFSTYDQKGNLAWHPDRTVDGSGLRDGAHSTGKNTGWMTERIDPSNAFIQWDLGASYALDAIRIWNLRTDKTSSVGVRSVDIYVSNVPFPGDPEGHEAQNWSRLGSGPVEFPQAPESGEPNTGFDLASILGSAFPSEPVRVIRFEINSSWKDGKNTIGLAEIRFSGKRVDSVNSARAATANVTKDASDGSAPEIRFQSPLHQAAGVNPRRNLTLVFNEPVVFGRGNVTLRDSRGKSVQAFDVRAKAPGLRLVKRTLTITPEQDLADATTYSIEIDSGAIQDLAGNTFPGIGDEKAWSFTTIVPDVTAPEIASTIPANGAYDFFPANNLHVTFNEWIALGAGFVHIRKSDGSLIESFDVTNPASGLSYLADTLTINPTEDLPLGTDFHVEIESSAILDNSGNNYPGTSGSTTWNFSVPASVDYTTITHVGTQFDIEAGTNNPAVGWRNPSPVKPLDIDGDNILGTDGYRTSDRTSDPAYAITAQRAPNANGGGKVYDDPTNPSGDDIGLAALHDASAGNGQESAPLIQFVITEDLPAGTTLRVGILFDLITVSAGTNTATYTLKQTFGGTATVTTPVYAWNGDSMDVAYFDLTNVRATHTYVITSTTIATPNHPGPFEQVIGVTFDTGR